MLNLKAGVDFSYCTAGSVTRRCGTCPKEQRTKCEAIASLDKHYTDDPRNFMPCDMIQE